MSSFARRENPCPNYRPSKTKSSPRSSQANPSPPPRATTASTESTIYEWRRENAAFQFVLDQARARHQAALYDLVQDLAEQALETVATALTSEDVNVRLRAAQIILRVAAPGHRAPASLHAPAPTSPTPSPRAFGLATEDRNHMDIESLVDESRGIAASPLPKSDTIRQNPTLSPSRNSRCACGSGLKYKRCCGDIKMLKVSASGSMSRFASGSN